MTAGMSRILLVTGDEALEQRLRSLLTLPDFTVQRVGTTREAMELADSEDFEMLLVDFPPTGPDLGELLRVARWSGALWRTSAAILLAEEEDLDDAERYLTRGVTRILNRSAPDRRLRAALMEVVDAPPRTRIRGLVRLDLSSVSDKGSVLAQTENLSRSGMLVRTDVFVPLGSHVPFSLEIPGQNRPIRGEATVVRLARPATDGIEGFASTFSRLEADGVDRLGAYVDQQIRRQQAGSREP